MDKKTLIIPDCQDPGYEALVIVPANKYDYSDIEKAIQEAKDENPNEWQWADIEDKLIALGYEVPCWERAAFSW